MVPTEGPCLEGCNACSQACPTDAIMKYPIEKKYHYKSGTAVLDTSKCVSYTERKFCSECVRACPTDAFEIVKGWEPPRAEGESCSVRGQPITASALSHLCVKGADFPAPDGKTPTRPIHVNFDKCIGCGACEFECNKIVFGEPAMITTSYGRATASNL